MPFELNGFENYNLTFSLNMAVQEREGVKHFFYGCGECDGKIERHKYCPSCQKTVDTKKVWKDGEPEEVGSRDCWVEEDDGRIPFSDIELQRITNWKWVAPVRAKKMKASEVRKLKKLGVDPKAGSNSLLELRRLFVDLAKNKQALKTKIVFQGKINDGFIIPYPFFKKHKALIMGIADGNKESIDPKEELFVEQKVAVKTGQKKKKKEEK